MRKKGKPDVKWRPETVDQKRIIGCEAAISRLIDEISKLQHRVKELEQHHIHYQDVFQAGSTGEPVFLKTKKGGRNEK